MENEQIHNLLKFISYPEDLRKLTLNELPLVCEELRQDIIKELSCNPGHFAASLGVVDSQLLCITFTILLTTASYGMLGIRHTHIKF